MIRQISHSECTTLLECPAQWDFRYGGHLAGDALEPRIKALRLREGSAWGRAIAVLQTNPDDVMAAGMELLASLEEDADQLREAGAYDADAHEQTTEHLVAILQHHHETWEPLIVDRLEHELEVPVPSRTGGRSSNRYRFYGRVDGIHTDEHGEWIVENKLRGELSPFDQVVKSQQIRRYAWAWRQITGRSPVGVIVDERLNLAPKPPKINKDGRPSSDKRQITTPELYAAACARAGVDPDPDTLEAFGQRKWHARHRVFLTEAEIDDAGRQLVSLARYVHLLDSGELYPVRNPSRQRCNGCAFRDACPNPDDREFVDALYLRVPAKRNRDLQEV